MHKSKAAVARGQRHLAFLSKDRWGRLPKPARLQCVELLGQLLSKVAEAERTEGGREGE